MRRRRFVPPAALGLALLCGCAAASRSAPTAPRGEPDCSFHSATTCWTVAGRFPTPRAAQSDSTPEEFLKQPPPLLASGADSTGAPR